MIEIIHNLSKFRKYECVKLRCESTRIVILGALVLAFAIQSYLVYTDKSGRKAVLSSLELSGQKLWRENNCQVCHQLYGFGGFLGGDLTNVVRKLNKSTFKNILAIGPKQMPQFHFSEGEALSLYSYLSSINQTGISSRTLRNDRIEFNSAIQFISDVPWFRTEE